jgi:hypothetical protein
MNVSLAVGESASRVSQSDRTQILLWCLPGRRAKPSMQMERADVNGGGKVMQRAALLVVRLEVLAGPVDCRRRRCWFRVSDGAPGRMEFG